MIAAEQFRRRLMSNSADIDCGYIIAKYSPKVGKVQLLGEDFNISQVKKMYINGTEVKPIKDYDSSGVELTVRIEFGFLWDMKYMFSETYELQSLDCSHLDTKNVLIMQSWVTGTGNFISPTPVSSIVGLKNWDTSKVTTMRAMFIYTGGLTKIDLAGWNTSKVTDMSGMFFGSSIGGAGFEEIDLTGWDTSKVTDMSNMFCNCYFLKKLTMTGLTNPSANVTDLFTVYGAGAQTQNGVFYYNPRYDYSHIIAQLPSTWTAIPVTQ